MKAQLRTALSGLMIAGFCAGCSSPPEGQIALQGTWKGIPGGGADGVVVEFSGSRFVYTDEASDYRASGTFTAYPNYHPKWMVQNMTQASSDPSISTDNPWVSYSIYEIIDGVLTLGYSEAQNDPTGLPMDFTVTYAMEKFQRVEMESDIGGYSKN